MDQGVEVFVPVLFWVLAGFAILNIVINLVLLYIRRERIHVLLSIFWPVVLAVFLLQSWFQQGEQAVILAFGATFVPVTLGAIIGFELIGRTFPLKAYLVFYCFTFVLTLVFFSAGLPFEIAAMPFGIGSGVSHLHYVWYALYRDRHRSTPLQKLLACSFFVSGVHGINFALFRMDPGAQLWGWTVAYATYDSFAIILPALALENAYRTEKERLQNLIDARTMALDKSLEQNRSLLKILLHDVHTPLSVIGMYISTLRPDVPPGPKVLANIESAHDALESIVASVKVVHRSEDHALESELIDMEESCRQAISLFDASLERKRLSLQFTSSVERECKVRMNRSLFVHTVLGNLLSNAIKFSPPGSTIAVSLSEDVDRVVLQVRDEGTGIPPETLEQLRGNRKVTSSTGTQGEAGMGLGLSIVKSIVELFEGRLTFEWHQQDPSGGKHGTQAVVTFRKALA